MDVATLIIIYLALVLFGAALGSFAGATLWRLRARQLDEDKRSGQSYDRKEYKSFANCLVKKTLQDRSRCLHCGYELKWYDLIPIVSWLTLGGKCRSCKKPIGGFELWMELGVATFFVLSFAFWPGELVSGLQIAHFILWLVAGVIMAVLFAYDLKWFLLPDRYTLALAIVGAAIVAVMVVKTGVAVDTIVNALGAVGVIAGLYGVLYWVSGGRWVGFGDVKLGVGLGLILGDWKLAFIAVFLANLVGCIIVIPLLATKKLSRSARVPFGPLLITGTVLAWFTGVAITSWYLQNLGL